MYSKDFLRKEQNVGAENKIKKIYVRHDPEKTSYLRPCILHNIRDSCTVEQQVHIFFGLLKRCANVKAWKAWILKWQSYREAKTKTIQDPTNLRWWFPLHIFIIWLQLFSKVFSVFLFKTKRLEQHTKILSQKISIIISLLWILQNQNICYKLQNCGLVSDLHCKNSFRALDDTAVMVIVEQDCKDYFCLLLKRREVNICLGLSCCLVLNTVIFSYGFKKTYKKNI